jgi:hypothetical protein
MVEDDFGTVQNVRGSSSTKRMRSGFKLTSGRGSKRGAAHGTALTERPTAHRLALLASAPLMALLDDLQRKVSADRRFGLNSPEHQAFVGFAESLANAIDEARRADTWLTIEELQVMTGRPSSTLSRWCREHGSSWANCRGKIWHIYYPAFQTWLAGEQAPAQAAA